MKNRFMVVIIFMFFPVFLLATTLELDDHTIVKNVTQIEKQLSDQNLTIFKGITIAKSNLSDVKKTLGEAVITESGEAGSYLRKLCYFGDDGTTVLFESGELGGPKADLDTVKIFPSLDKKQSKNCTNSKKINKDSAIIFGLKLDLSTKTVKKMLGKPSKEAKDRLIYYYHTVEKSKGETFDVCTTIELKIVKGKVTLIDFSKTETN